MTLDTELDVGMRPLSAMDLAILEYQAGVPAPIAGGCVLRVEGACDLEALRAAILERVRLFPTLTDRLAYPNGPRRRPVWASYPAFDVTEHVHEHELPDGDLDAGLRAFVEQRYRAPLRMDIPPWEVCLLRGPGADESSVFFRSSHVWADGMAALRALGMLFGPVEAPDSAAQWRRDVRTTPRAVFSALSSLLAWSSPSASLRALAQPVSGEIRMHWATTSTDRLRAIGRAYGTSVNDVFLVAFSEALAGWSEPTGRRGGPHALMPISTRRPHEFHLLGNFTTGTRVRLPAGAASPWHRVEAIRRQTSMYRRGHRSGAGERWWFEKIPPRYRQNAVRIGMSPRLVAVSTSNLGALPGPMAAGGLPIVEVLPLPVLMPEQRLSLSLGSLGPHATVGIMTDSRVTDGAALADLWLAALDRLEQAAGSSVPRTREASTPVAAKPEQTTQPGPVPVTGRSAEAS